MARRKVGAWASNRESGATSNLSEEEAERAPNVASARVGLCPFKR
jgi:hypothetical protein